MDNNKKVLKSLLEAKGFLITDKENNLFEEFSELIAIKSNIEIIQAKQIEMVELWRKKTKINDFINAHLIMPNATVGKPYSFKFEIETETFQGIRILDIKIENENVLCEYDATSAIITAMFTEAGQFNFTITFELEDDAVEGVKNIKEIKVLVNPDPKTLWKNLDSNIEDPYWKEDNISASAVFGTKKFIVGSKRGRSHAHEGIFRDDDFDFHYNSETGWGIIAVADGAGGSKYSRKGSLLACKAVVDYFKNLEIEQTDFITDIIISEMKASSEANQKLISSFCITHLGKAAFSALNNIRDEAKIKEAEIKDFSTTLLFAFIKEFDEHLFVSSFWVGDGGIGIYLKEPNTITLLGVPDSGEFSGQTRFLTMSEIFADNAYISRIKYKIVPKSAKLLLMSDGITDAKFQTDAALEKIEVWNEVISDLEGKNEDNHAVDFNDDHQKAEKQLMQWMDFWSPGNHDDRTIAILY
jgi:serine/threonine protein phosphatase PrpC